MASGAGARARQEVVAANAVARARREGVWQQTRERAVAETEEWRCGCAPERETAEKVWQQTSKRAAAEEV